jgi:hypothetical protein
MKRRTFLKIGTTALTASGLDGILAARRAPAFGQTTRIHLLHWPDFIPEGDVELRRQIAEYNKQMNTDVFMENINGNDLQPRITAAIQTGAGPDIIFMLHNWPHLYASSLADVSDSLRVEGQDRERLLRSIRPPRTAAAGSPCPTASWATRWPIASRGSPRRATQPPRRWTSGARSGRAQEESQAHLPDPRPHLR